MTGPIKEFKAGPIRAAIWENATDKGKFHTVTLSRSYKGDDGEWNSTNNFRINDLPKAELVLRRAYAHLMED